MIGRFENATDFYYKDSNGTIQQVPLPKELEIGENGVWIGDYIFEDVNKDGVIDDEDRTYIGNPEPKFTYGIGNTFSYKCLDLTIYLTGSYGNDVVNYSRRFLENPRENANLLVKATKYARLGLIDPDGPNDFRNVQIVGGDWDMPRITASSAAASSNYRFSDKFVEDGSYLRIQNISIGYNLPRQWVTKIGLQNLKVYANLQNVYT
ncbi:MAG: TonB-dependent receptor, partial [Bacteroides sp.]|nr:TonB-dependent receptor [Bacteroides sp.]